MLPILDDAILRELLPYTKPFHAFVVGDPLLPDYPLVYANPLFLDHTGYTLEEVLGRNCRFLQGEKTNRDTVSIIRHAIKTHVNLRIDILNYKKDGTPFWNRLDIRHVLTSFRPEPYIIGIQIPVAWDQIFRAPIYGGSSNMGRPQGLKP
ncbi:MAG: PAS domain-containing protein [Alphaproteobacteria bacterium]